MGPGWPLTWTGSPPTLSQLFLTQDRYIISSSITYTHQTYHSRLWKMTGHFIFWTMTGQRTLQFSSLGRCCGMSQLGPCMAGQHILMGSILTTSSSTSGQNQFIDCNLSRVRKLVKDIVAPFLGIIFLAVKKTKSQQNCIIAALYLTISDCRDILAIS